MFDLLNKKALPHDNDLIHEPVPQSIYVRTDYIVNSDMAIPLGLAVGWNQSVVSELAVRTGLPFNDRRPEDSPLVLRQPKIPKGK